MKKADLVVGRQYLMKVRVAGSKYHAVTGPGPRTNKKPEFLPARSLMKPVTLVGLLPRKAIVEYDKWVARGSPSAAAVLSGMVRYRVVQTQEVVPLARILKEATIPKEENHSGNTRQENDLTHRRRSRQPNPSSSSSRRRTAPAPDPAASGDQ